jgi:hypothetical protein
MKDEFVTCECCGRATCYKTTYDNTADFALMCFSCGMTTTSFCSEGSEMNAQIDSTAPELYKDLKVIDSSRLVWYPATVTIPEKGIVFLDGAAKDSIRWAAVRATEISDKERAKYPLGQKYKTDMTTAVYFPQDDFTLALQHINFFEL